MNKLQNFLNSLRAVLTIEALSMALVIFIAYLLFLNTPLGLKEFNGGDVHMGFQRGIDILNGVNPYLEFNPDGLLRQNKVPGFFGMYFFLMALLVRISSDSFVLFLDTLRYFVFVAYASTGVLLYWLIRKQNKLLAFVCMIIYMFNRWTLNDVLFLKQDSYVILILLISLLTLKSRPLLSFVLYGLATSIKHLTILVLPIYLLEAFGPVYTYWLTTKTVNIKNLLNFVGLGLLIVGPAILSSLPFALQTPKEFVFAILYNVTRAPEATGLGSNTGFDSMLILYNQDRLNTAIYYMLPRLPLVVSLIFSSILYIRKKLNIWKFAGLTYLIFVGFNPVLFDQYFVWFITFVPFMFLESPKQESPTNATN